MFHKLFNIQHTLKHEVSEYFISTKLLEGSSEKQAVGYLVQGLEISLYYLWIFDNYIDIYSSLPMRNKTFFSWMC